ncbi:MAG: flippase-like domain-containing protein [Deltaproteobacteria bacterium]|nr:MAG: flippase-like domain-containing protein [Deltaproteobacteria bacterium]
MEPHSDPAPALATFDGHERHLASHVFNIAMLVFGAGALAWMVRELDWERLRIAVLGVASWFAIILGLDLAAVLIEARALHTFMRPEARMVSYWRVAAAQISGRAVNVVTPFGALGEATKLTMLVSHAPRARVVSAVVLYNLAAFYLSVIVMLIGVPITLLLIDLPHSLKLTVAVALAVLISLMIALGVIINRGALSTLTRLLRGLRIIAAARLDDWRTRLRDIDDHIAELHRARSAGTWRGILWVIAARLVSWTSTMTLINAIGVALTPHLVIGVLSVGVLIAWIASIVPLGFGLADGGNYGLYHLLGASGAHGAFVTMLNRGRSLAVATVGFIVMAIVHTINRLALARVHRKLRALRPAMLSGSARTP